MASNRQQISLVIDAPHDAAYISYGIWMIGNGKCCLRNPEFKIVSEDVLSAQPKFGIVSERWEEQHTEEE